MKTSRTVVGVDTAKRVFQLHWVDTETGEIVDLRLTRAKFLEHFANRALCLVAMEACGGSQHWARRIRELGHEVLLLPAKIVRPFVGGNKNHPEVGQRGERALRPKVALSAAARSRIVAERRDRRTTRRGGQHDPQVAQGRALARTRLLRRRLLPV